MGDRPRTVRPDEVEGKPFLFVSYSRQDLEPVQDILRILRANHFRFWYDMGLKSGVEWAEELGKKIDQCDQFLVIISSNSVKSKFVRKEIGMATELDKNIVVIYIEETVLSSGLSLLLGDIQSIHRSFYSRESDFQRSLCEAISSNTLYQSAEVFTPERTGDAERGFMGSYTILSKLGAGGIAQVFLARHNRTGALSAVKCGNIGDSYMGNVTLECFETERAVLSELMSSSCPNVPVLLDWYMDERQVFLIESFISGESLKSDTALSEEEVVGIGRKVLKILARLHESGIVYRDMKPGNLIRDKFGDIHLIDFNTAILTETGGVAPWMLMGTRGFAAPEQYSRKAPCGPTADIYGLGRTMEYLLSPQNFDMNSRAPIRYLRRDVSVGLEAVLERMTAPESDARYSTAGEAAEALERCGSLGPIKRAALTIRSNRGIRRYAAQEREIRERRRRDIGEFTQRLDGDYEEMYETEKLSDDDTETLD